MMLSELSRWRGWVKQAPLWRGTSAQPVEDISAAVAQVVRRESQSPDRTVQKNVVVSEDINRVEAVADSSIQRYMLWIDGVGAWQLCAGSQFLIGGPTLEHASADICLMANLSRRHATLQRTGEDWFIHPHQSTVVSGRAVTGPTLLRTGDAICLAERVRLGFRIPSVLSGSALIDFESHHRPVQTVNGIILMTDSVLLGPRKDYHICCPDWPELVVVYRQDGQLRCKSKATLKVNGERVRDSVVLNDGAIVSGEDFRFRVETLKS